MGNNLQHMLTLMAIFSKIQASIFSSHSCLSPLPFFGRVSWCWATFWTPYIRILFKNKLIVSIKKLSYPNFLKLNKKCNWNLTVSSHVCPVPKPLLCNSPEFSLCWVGPGLSELASINWGKLAPNGTNLGILRSVFCSFWLNKPKWKENWS